MYETAEIPAIAPMRPYRPEQELHLAMGLMLGIMLALFGLVYWYAITHS
jgi:hypothetical protein